jgi:hypothetical protein
VTWTRAPDQEFTHVLSLAEYARTHCFEPMTISAAVNRYAAMQSG